MQKLNISTQRLQVRNLEIADLVPFHQYRCDPEVTKYQGFDVMNLEAAEQFVTSQLDKLFGKPGEWVQYAIVQKDTELLIGDCAIKLHEHEPRIAEIGITITPAKQKQGYAKEALIGILSYLFDQQKLHAVVELVASENLASIKLLEGTGFRKEGHFKESYFFEEKWRDEFQYALLDSEWSMR